MPPKYKSEPIEKLATMARKMMDKKACNPKPVVKKSVKPIGIPILKIRLQKGNSNQFCYIFGTKKHGLSKIIAEKNLILVGVSTANLFQDAKNKLATADIDSLTKHKDFLKKEIQQSHQLPGKNELKIMLKAIIELIEEKKDSSHLKPTTNIL